jgi:hypothetical protein
MCRLQITDFRCADFRLQIADVFEMLMNRKIAWGEEQVAPTALDFVDQNFYYKQVAPLELILVCEKFRVIINSGCT